MFDQHDELFHWKVMVEMKIDDVLMMMMMMTKEKIFEGLHLSLV